MSDNIIREAAKMCQAETIEEAFMQGVSWVLRTQSGRGGYDFNLKHYKDPNTGNRCDTFVVTDPSGNVVYERDYGSTGQGFTSYVDDYFRYINGIGYRSDTSGFEGYKTNQTTY